MIKIKNIIFNKSDIVFIEKVETGIRVCPKTLNVSIKEIKDATFDDIEWNYDDSYVQRIKEKCRKLEEENKKFDVIKEILKREKRIYGSLTDAGEEILKTIYGVK